MKAINFLAAIIILVLSTQLSFAVNDGTSKDKSPVIITLELKSLLPVVPSLADFPDIEIEGDEFFLTPPSSKFAPEYPQEADFDDQPTEK